jgi:hypothetical protein
LTGKTYGQQRLPSDTLCFDLPTVRKLVSNSEQGKLLKQQVLKLDERIVLLQSTISNLQVKDSLTISSHNKEINELRGKEDLCKGQLNDLTRLLKRERFKRKLTAASGIITTGLAVFLSLKK